MLKYKLKVLNNISPPLWLGVHGVPYPPLNLPMRIRTHGVPDPQQKWNISGWKAYGGSERPTDALYYLESTTKMFMGVYPHEIVKIIMQKP